MTSIKEEHENCESIHQYVQLHNNRDPDIQNLCDQWMELCNELDIDFNCIRCKMDNWFIEVYRSREVLQQAFQDKTTGKLQTYKDALYQKFLSDSTKMINPNAVFEKMQMNAAISKIKTKYPLNPGEWVDLAVQCFQKEIKLLNGYTRVRRESEQVKQALLKVEQDIQLAEQIKLRINDDLKEFRGKVSTLRDLHDKREEKQGHLRDCEFVGQALLKQNGALPNKQVLQTKLNQIHDEIKTVTKQVKTLHQQVSQGFSEIHVVLERLVPTLIERVEEWQREFMYDYAELVASPTPDLDEVALWCARTGRILYDVLHESLVNWQNFIGNVDLHDDDIVKPVQTYTHVFQDMITNFIQSTFVVTEQGNFFIKTGNKRFPKFTVRVLAADHFSKHSEQTTAYFVSEDDLKTCCDRDDIDLSRLKKVEKKLKSNKIKFSTENGKDKMECCFQNLQFEQPFKRSNKETSKQVHEEKYRVVFTTIIESKPCWTLSLPLVVTTASNQEVHSLASIMWQCYSTDVFLPASDIPEELPWCQVADMLQKKMARLSSKHNLSHENITHLKNRVFGEENISDEEPLSLTNFCWTYMHDTEFSFWKWFLGVYNLIEQYLQPFWNDGLIMGFVNKETAERMLETCNKAGTFILRFSDKHFTNSDGRKSVYGRLTSCVVVIKDGKGPGNKRDSSSQHEPHKRKVLEHVDVADFKKLGGEVKKQELEEGPKNNLANILKETWIKGRDGQSQIQMYRFVFPSEKRREELFDKYCEEAGHTVSGYRHTREAYIAILEQTMAKVNISMQADESTSFNQDITSKLGAACIKKPRRSRDTSERIKKSPRRSSSCQSNLSTPQGSPFLAQSPQSHCQSPVHPCTSPGYPIRSPYPTSSSAQSFPSPAFSCQMQARQNIDSDSANIGRLPIFVTEEYPREISKNVFTFPNNNDEQANDNLQSSERDEVEDLQGFDAMEVSAENDNLIFDPIFPQTSMNQTAIRESDDNLIEPRVESQVVNFPDNEIIIQDSDGNVTELGEHVFNVVTRIDGKFSLAVVGNDDGEIKTSPSYIPSIVANYLKSHLTQDQFNQVLSWLEENQQKAEEVLQQTGRATLDVGSGGSGDIPISTSSGSSGELPGGFSANQLAAMGSGDIDPNFAMSIVAQDNIDGSSSSI